MPYTLWKFIFKSTVPLVYVEVVFFIKIVADINIRIHIAVYIRHGNAQAIRYLNASNSCFFTHICKIAIIILKKFMSSEAITNVANSFNIEFSNIFKAVI